MIIHCEKCNKPVEILETIYDQRNQVTTVKVQCHGVEKKIIMPDYAQNDIIILRETQ